MKLSKMIKLGTLTISFTFSLAAISAIDSGSGTTNDWQSSLAAEFSKLDASGNGLLMPSEASKGKAFNKKTFATADADQDGTIDQAEYIQHKIGMGATNQPGNPNTSTPSGSSSANATTEMSTTSSNLDNDTANGTAEMAQNNAETKERPVGVVIEDSVITTKAKAAIFSTPDLKTLQISVETRQGEVTLTGMVDSVAAKMKAEEVVKNVEGVSKVMNNLEVKG